MMNPDLVPDGQRWTPPLTVKSPKSQLKRAALIHQLANRDGWLCRFCRRPLAMDGGVEIRATFDHWIPRSRLPQPEKNHRHPDKLVLSCQPCNQIKDSMTGEEFLAIPYQEREARREVWLANLRKGTHE